MATLHHFLKTKGYCRVQLRLLNTNHFVLDVMLNGAQGRFLLDTGASDTCVAMDKATYFKLHPKPSDEKAASASSNEMHTEVAHYNTIQIGNWNASRRTVVLFDMQTVNLALEQQKATAVEGIIGADILRKSDAIIDYNHHWLYLKN